jgi:hypothetical protein
MGSTLPTERIRENIFCDRDDRMMVPKLVKAGDRQVIYYFCPDCGYSINPLAEKDRKKAIVITTTDGHNLNQDSGRVGPRTLVTVNDFKMKRARQTDQEDPTAYDDISKIMRGNVMVTHRKIDRPSKRNSISRILVIN